MKAKLACAATLLCWLAVGCSDDVGYTPIGAGGGNLGSGGSGINSGGSLATGGSGGSFAAAGSGGSGGGAPANPGATLFATNCVKCHGEAGMGTLLAPGIQHPIRDYFSWVVRNGRAVTTYAKPMEKWGTDKLSDADLTLIFDYLDTPPQPTTGAALFADYCANCHGADATGGVAEHNLLSEVAKINDMVRKGAHPGMYEERNEFMPAFTQQRLSDADLELIHDYVDSL
ncbi:MAG TPA: c-type cytochrome [Polyangiaceae bacterium]